MREQSDQVQPSVPHQVPFCARCFESGSGSRFESIESGSEASVDVCAAAVRLVEDGGVNDIEDDTERVSGARRGPLIASEGLLRLLPVDAPVLGGSSPLFWCFVSCTDDRSPLSV